MRSRPVLDAVEIPAFDRADLLDELSNEDGFHPVLLGERPNVGQAIDSSSPQPGGTATSLLKALQPIRRQRRTNAIRPTTPKDSLRWEPAVLRGTYFFGTNIFRSLRVYM
jgi:hypothetical protein